ncbi:MULTISPECIES: SDR family oxidoreductase [Pseudomonas]|uniref:UDP-glucose 4-epimerase family protein n=1 Tax=Pseudomonas TaxID=286 RepID=UPI000482F935|nr:MULTISPECIES: SDR family oxidoreductase [Pseudomonas]PRA59376.1 NAD-dependent dehydratase [Pseudomonas sp. MYb115]QXN48827.1 SDR family oxidoreductase [Pseudomonas fluorescens]WSO23137.1 SDR family oxidoreductase [Pseudomonas fluorescens]
MRNQIILTGATGFVGGATLNRLQREQNHPVVAVVRGESSLQAKAVPLIRIATFDGDTQWHDNLQNADVIIHSAARVHVMNDVESDPLAAFRKVNVDGTLNLARQAAASGVRRFIFVSSIKVNGEGTKPGTAYTADDVPAPADPYGISKMEAEQGLRELAARTGMEVVIVRPVLVYGPGVKANFLNMMRWLSKGIPLPFGAIHNRRSLVALDNLVDLLLTCIHHPAAANQTFLVSDGDDLSTTALLSKMAKALKKPARLIPVPSWILESGASMLGKKALSQRLCGSLQVDITKTRTLLGWAPPVSVDEALTTTALHFKEHQ